jgi:hypothetical protein
VTCFRAGVAEFTEGVQGGSGSPAATGGGLWQLERSGVANRSAGSWSAAGWRHWVRGAAPRYDFSARELRPRLCALEHNRGVCRTGRYYQSLTLLAIGSACGTLVLVLVLAGFRRCRRCGSCGGSDPSNGLCFVSSCPYRCLCVCEGCCMGHGRCRRRCDRDCALFPVDLHGDEASGDRAGVTRRSAAAAAAAGQGGEQPRRAGGRRLLFDGYKRRQIVCARLTQLPCTVVLCLVTLPALYTPIAAAVYFGTAMARARVVGGRCLLAMRMCLRCRVLTEIHLCIILECACHESERPTAGPGACRAWSCCTPTTKQPCCAS